VPTPVAPRALDREILSRRLGHIMLVRVILYTLILGGTVGVNFAWGTPDELGGPYVTLFFVFIAGMFVLNIGYAILLRHLPGRLREQAVAQIVVDLTVSAALVHFTGGADSAFVLFFLLSPIAAAVTLDRRAALLAALCGTVVFAAVSILGFYRMLPPLPGQLQVPWDLRPGAVGRSVLVNGAAMFAVALLSGYLAEQLRAASQKMEVQQAFIDDLAVLNTDIIRCLTSGLITVNPDGRILSLNRAASEILGLGSHPVAGQRLADLVPELGALAAGSELRRGEVPVARDRGGPLRLGISVSRLTDHMSASRGSIISFQDLTALREMEVQIQRSEQLASLGRMAAGIAHEIRNPLASISGSLELLQAAQGLSAEEGRLMEIALREIERLNGLITDFLEYARPRSPNLELLDLGEEIASLAGTIAGLMGGPDVPTVKVVERDSGLWVRADRDHLSGVLWDLVRNAREAGEVHQVDLAVGRQADGQVFLAVSDRAEGIAEEHLEHIFEPFFTRKEKGTGLGLATVQRIVQEHGGSIDVRSTVGRGTTFTILLPPAAAPEAQP
jgi:two-component system sensor histidine kinase PilS (NtrC family)